MPDWVITLGSFFAGVVSGVLGKYLADKWTDSRRNNERVEAIVARFKLVKKDMPELLTEMRIDLSNPNKGAPHLYREFKLSDSEQSEIPSRSPIYFEDEHQNLQGKVHILENLGFVAYVGNCPDGCPVYRMSEEFVSLLLSDEGS